MPRSETTSATPVPGDRLPGGLRCALGLVIVAGLAMRVIYPADTVFCEDQAHACALAQDIANGHWQTGGLLNSGGFRNLPGFVYVLAAVWKVFPDPVALIHFTGLVNCLGVLAAWWLLRRWGGSAAAWWGTAFFAAAPWAIHYSRWIWAQHLLFPAALVVYFFLWRWVVLGKRWAALGVVFGLTLLAQIHLVGVVLGLAIGLVLLWLRPRLPLIPLTIGVALAVMSVLPYLLDRNLGIPGSSRTGFSHAWRVVPGAAMSVSGLWWQLEFSDGYHAFAASLSWRRWPYELVMGVPVVLLGIAVVVAVTRLVRSPGSRPATRRTPLMLVSGLVLAIPLSFALLAIRTSPTYLPLWYPLPFALMGGVVAQFLRRRSPPGRAALTAGLLGVLVVQLGFFAEQLAYIHRHGGVPGSLIGRSYAGMLADLEPVADETPAAELWLRYEGPSQIQGEPAAYLLRRTDWTSAGHGRAVLRFNWFQTDGEPLKFDSLFDDAVAPSGAFRIRPWTGPQQVGSEIPLVPG